MSGNAELYRLFRQAQRAIVEDALGLQNWSMGRTAAALGVHRSTLHRYCVILDVRFPAEIIPGRRRRGRGNRQWQELGSRGS